jgi:uncharacterized protein (DUF1778 family)
MVVKAVTPGNPKKMIGLFVRRRPVRRYLSRRQAVEPILTAALWYRTLSVRTRKESSMPRAAVGDNMRLALRIQPEDKAIIMRAVALAQTDMTTFILRTALKEARAVIDEHERVKLTERDSRLVMELLENPPAPNAKLRKAARALRERP